MSRPYVRLKTAPLSAQPHSDTLLYAHVWSSVGVMTSTEHETHSHPDHVHGPDCGHEAVTHDDHVDYVHDGHRHAPHGDHYDEH